MAQEHAMTRGSARRTCRTSLGSRLECRMLKYEEFPGDSEDETASTADQAKYQGTACQLNLSLASVGCS